MKSEKSKKNRQIPDTPLTCKLLKKYKKEGKSDYNIGLLHGKSTSWVWTLRKKCGIQGLYGCRYRAISKETVAAIFKEYRLATSVDDICKCFGIDRPVYMALCLRYLTADDKMAKRNILNDRKRNELLRLQRIYKNDGDIAKVLGITRQRVQQKRVALGVPLLLADNKTTVYDDKQSQ